MVATGAEVAIVATAGNTKYYRYLHPRRASAPRGCMISCMGFVRATLGWGIVIYAVMYLAWSGLAVYGLTAGMLVLVLRLLVLAGITTLAAHDLKVSGVTVAKYSAFWGLVAILLDIVLLVPFIGLTFYAEWGVWLGYALVVAIPIGTSELLNRKGAVQR